MASKIKWYKKLWSGPDWHSKIDASVFPSQSWVFLFYNLCFYVESFYYFMVRPCGGFVKWVLNSVANFFFFFGQTLLLIKVSNKLFFLRGTCAPCPLMVTIPCACGETSFEVCLLHTLCCTWQIVVFIVVVENYTCVMYGCDCRHWIIEMLM